MFSFFPRERRIRRPHGSHFSSPSTTKGRRRQIAFDETRRVQASSDEDENSRDDVEESGETDDNDNEDDDSQNDELAPLLPIFEASHLDALPVYNLTHAIRLLVVPRIETTLTWDQLRSPQISQFMIKPIQKNILTSHFSRATLYALLSNSLQFSKEAAENPGNAGTSKTRAMACELLAIRLLKEYSIRELIDALSYDFYPLQGLHTDAGVTQPTVKQWELPQLTKQQPRTARVSTLEIAIRAEAKRFLAHPVVVQQLEAIWAGTIVFHSAADNAHRPQNQLSQGQGYGAIARDRADSSKTVRPPVAASIQARKTVTIYDPREASLFKLSRLRVPRYRSFFSTLSLAILLGLFVAVLAEKSINITLLEVIFWMWSAGFMLDEVVGLTDQGFNLYLLSFWNAFDLGILFVLFVFYCLRLYGLVIADDSRKWVAYLAYDVLGLNAILLFPRLFSVLDHYRYFSQLLIAFRIMARDLVAVLVLIGISCSGFFVAFTLAFGNDLEGPGDVAYALFQLIMGFTPAAWERWAAYNRLGQAALVLFLFITHFLVVTILITVLTNSFMSIVQNANDEHQFVFAINTISMVKSDALFSYVAPTNIIAWLLTPLRSCLPFRQYVKLNRTIIKITHFPILFGICAYERLVLQRSVYEPTDLIERRGRPSRTEEDGLFTSRTIRTRERSAATMFQDKALEAVFQRPLRHSSSRLTRTSGAESARPDVTQPSARPDRPDRVDSWMSQMDTDGPTGPPAEQDRGIVDRLEKRRGGLRNFTPRRSGLRNFTTTMSVVSDPEDFMQTTRLTDNISSPYRDGDWQDATQDDLLQVDNDGDDEHAAGDGDDEHAAGDGDDEHAAGDGADGHGPASGSRIGSGTGVDARGYFRSMDTVDSSLRQPSNTFSHQSTDFAISFEDRKGMATPENVSVSRSKISPQSNTQPSTRPPSQGGISKAKQREIHNRTLSTNTILYSPLDRPDAASSTASKVQTNKTKDSKSATRVETPTDGNIPRASPSNKKLAKQRRPLLDDRAQFLSSPNIGDLLARDATRNTRGQRSPYNFDLVSDLGDNKAVAGQYMAGMPASFGTHLDFMNMNRSTTSDHDNEEQRRMGKLMLSRMNTLEQGFREVLKEVKDWRRGDGEGYSSKPSSSHVATPALARRATRDGKTTRALGKKRREAHWVEDAAPVSSPRTEADDENRALSTVAEGEMRGSSV